MKRVLMAAAIGVSLVATLAPVQAAEVPPPGTLDFRVRQVVYNEGQVYRLTGFFGFHAIVLFGPDEHVEKVSGYDTGWTVESLGNKVLISPKEPEADSNLTVVTNRRVYFFDLTVKSFPAGGKYRSQAEDFEQTYGLRFRYPDDEARVAAAQAEARRLEQRLREAQVTVQAKPQHWNYTYMGADAIRPYAVWDDGTFTYFKFYAQQDLPSFFVVNADGTESIVNKGMERDGDTVVVQRVGTQFRLRMGNSVTCIYNENGLVFTPSSPTKTTSERVQRVIRGDQE